MDGCWVSPDARPGTAFGARPFWLLFVAMTKSNPHPEGERKLLTSVTSEREQDQNGFRLSPE
jgi:hypothetical protein